MSARDGRDGATRACHVGMPCEHYSFTVGVNNSTLLRQYPPVIAHHLNIDLEGCSTAFFTSAPSPSVTRPHCYQVASEPVRSEDESRPHAPRDTPVESSLLQPDK